jgi:hypothetical protein
MPSIPIRRRLLNELDDIDRTVKRARLSRHIQELVEDIMASDNGDDSDDDDLSSASVSDVSSLSSLSMDLNDNAISSSSDSSDSESLNLSDIEQECFQLFEAELSALKHEIINTRVLQPGSRIKKLSQIHLLDDWRIDNLAQFRKKVRVDPTTFDALLNKIEHHHVFYNNSHVPQAPVKKQLAIFLNRAGHYGNGSSPEEIGLWAGVSPGSVNNATNRVMVALLSLHDEAIHLPTAEEKESAKAWVEEQACPEWRDGHLLVDGTKFAVFQRPGLHGDAWFDKNKDYSLDCQVCV